MDAGDIDYRTIFSGDEANKTLNEKLKALAPGDSPDYTDYFLCQSSSKSNSHQAQDKVTRLVQILQTSSLTINQQDECTSKRVQKISLNQS